MSLKLHINHRVHAAIIRLTQPFEYRRARRFRRAAEKALKNNDFLEASEAILHAICCNPTIRKGAQLLARAKIGKMKIGIDYSGDAPAALHASRIEERLEKNVLISDPVIEVLLVLSSLRGDATKSIEALGQIKAHKRKSALTNQILTLLFRAISNRDEVRQVVKLISGVGTNETSDLPNHVVNNWLAKEMAFGVAHIGKHPLLDPEVFSAFTQTVKNGEPAVNSFPTELQAFIASGQVRSKQQTSYCECKKILVVSDNWNFFALPARALEASGFSVRFLDFNVIREAFPNTDRHFAISRLTRSLTEKASAEEVRKILAARSELAHDLLEWADVVFCEWFTDSAVWMSRYLPQDKKLISRLHSYETFTTFPIYANLRRVDGLIFIAPQIQKIFTSLVGEDVISDMMVRVIPNFRNITNFTFQQRETASQKTIGMTQYASANKDPCFALDILEALLASDPSWRLRLVGSPWGENLSNKDAAYAETFKQRVIELGDRVSIDGYTSDMLKWYQSVGFIVSASQREGSHESFVEGMLTGAVPVLRNWPMMAPFGAPASVFPGLELFASPKEAAQYIQRASAEFEGRSAAAAEYGLGHVNSIDPMVEFPRFIKDVCEAQATTTKRVTL